MEELDGDDKRREELSLVARSRPMIQNPRVTSYQATK
jgi:hypothetical protein